MPWPPLFIYAVAAETFYAIFMVCWDLWISYGMLRCWKYGKFGLREELHYPVWSYYIMIPYAELARFAYVLALVLDINNHPIM